MEDITNDSELSLYTVKDAARILKVTQQCIRNFTKDGRLNRIPRKDMVRYTKKEMLRFIGGTNE